MGALPTIRATASQSIRMSPFMLFGEPRARIVVEAEKGNGQHSMAVKHVSEREPLHLRLVAQLVADMGSPLNWSSRPAQIVWAETGAVSFRTAGHVGERVRFRLMSRKHVRNARGWEESLLLGLVQSVMELAVFLTKHTRGLVHHATERA